MSRVYLAGNVIHDQIDVFDENGSRIPGLTYIDFDMSVFFNNTVLNWPFAASNDPTPLVSSGVISLFEINENPGFYSLRFLPHTTGFFRVILVYNGIESIKEYDILPDLTNTSESFISFG